MALGRARVVAPPHAGVDERVAARGAEASGLEPESRNSLINLWV